MSKKRDLLDSDDEAPAAPKLKAKNKEVKAEKKKADEEPEEFLSLKVNKEFAKKYQEKKKAEELTRRTSPLLVVILALSAHTFVCFPLCAAFPSVSASMFL